MYLLFAYVPFEGKCWKDLKKKEKMKNLYFSFAKENVRVFEQQSKHQRNSFFFDV